MLSRWVRTWYGRSLKPFLLLLTLVSSFVLSQNHLIMGAIFLLLGGLLDGIDGELARVTNHATKFGAFLDSICDHSGDFALSLGLLWLYLNHTAPTEIVLIFAAL